MERSAWPKNLSSSRKHAIQELLHAQDPAKKLRHLFDAHSQTGNSTAQPLFAEDLVFNVVRSFSNTLSLSSGPESDEVLQVPTNACIRFEVSEESIKPNAWVRPEVSEESINRPWVPTNACVRPEVSEESIKPPSVPTNAWVRPEVSEESTKPPPVPRPASREVGLDRSCRVSEVELEL